MKKFILLIAVSAAALMSVTSCEDWLKATSSTQIQADELFTTKSGFQDALSGIYVLMGDMKAYGSNMTYFYSDLAAYPYLSCISPRNQYVQQHKYSNNEAVNVLVSQSWNMAYKVIAGINEILNYLEKNRNLFSGDLEYSLFKGELYGLRAYVHFDIMRYWGASSWNGGNSTKLTVPYVTVYGKEPTQQKSYEETCAMLLSDIETAIECLANDPVTGTVSDSFQNTCNAEGFWNNRTNRFNLYAAEALAARYYQWMKDYGTAAEYAQKVIDGALASGNVSWIDSEAQRTIIDSDARNWTFTPEHIFALNITGLYSEVQGLLMPGANGNMSDALRINQQFIDNCLFPKVDPETGSLAGEEDIRGTAMLLKLANNSYDCFKLYGSSMYPSTVSNRMPMIKLAEMYYIIADKYIHESNNAKALEMMDVVRANRGVLDALPSTVDAELELNKEYMREFINEGQIFHRFKSAGLEKYPGNGYFELQQSDLVLPYPQTEINYGRVQEL